tara:strand:+ start:1064 stop:1756 length:693 start_codon:yes stop_codon:yes gene_type:complete
MAISIDTVYQRVLTLANKEQRGYITPQEFNLLANQAQMEVFEQYFYDQSQQDKNLKNSTEFSNVDEILDEKISFFKEVQVLSVTAGVATLPVDMHRLGSLFYTTTLVEIEQVSEEEIMYLQQSPLAKPSLQTPAFVRNKHNRVVVYPSGLTGVSCNYVRRPVPVSWGYVVVNNDALYNSTTSEHFELHESEASELVYLILSLAGIVIAKPGLGTFADAQINAQKTQEKQQ